MDTASVVSVDLLKEILEAFNRRDLHAIMETFAEECVPAMPRGPHSWGRRYDGKAAVRAGPASRFTGIPDVHWGDDAHWVSGNHGVSTWLLTGTAAGRRLAVRGCDLLEFNDGLLTRKGSYWKVVEGSTNGNRGRRPPCPVP